MGGDKIVTLPISLVTLDGRKSSDDRGIMSYLWTRDDKSLAVGVKYSKDLRYIMAQNLDPFLRVRYVS